MANDHYYRIPKGTFGAAEDVYFNPIELKGYGRTWKEYVTDFLWKRELFNRYGLSGSFDESTIQAWKPEENHYKKVGDTFVKIEKPELGTVPAELDQDVQGCSPIGNTDGCADRMMIEKESALDLAKKIINANSLNRVAVYTFAANIKTKQTFTRDIAELEKIFSYHYGYGWTDYQSALVDLKNEFASSTNDKKGYFHVRRCSEPSQCKRRTDKC